MSTIHLAGSVACFVIGGLLAVMGGFLTFMCTTPFSSYNIQISFLECMGSAFGILFVTGIGILLVGIIIGVTAKPRTNVEK